jgi:hypothetical protein
VEERRRFPRSNGRGQPPNFLDILMMDELRHADVVEQALWEIVDLYLAGVIKPLVRRRLPNGARGSLLAAMITLETFGR